MMNKVAITHMIAMYLGQHGHVRKDMQEIIDQ
jgi:hypothetical protein